MDKLMMQNGFFGHTEGTKKFSAELKNKEKIEGELRIIEKLPNALKTGLGMFPEDISGGNGVRCDLSSFLSRADGNNKINAIPITNTVQNRLQCYGIFMENLYLHKSLITVYDIKTKFDIGLILGESKNNFGITFFVMEEYLQVLLGGSD